MYGSADASQVLPKDISVQATGGSDVSLIAYVVDCVCPD